MTMMYLKEKSEATELLQEKTESKATELLPEQIEFEEPELDNEVHNENSKTKEPMLAKYVRRHYAPD